MKKFIDKRDIRLEIIDRGNTLTELLHHMLAKLLGIDAISSYMQISQYRVRAYAIKRKLFLEKQLLASVDKGIYGTE
jgi:hypothetical protein